MPSIFINAEYIAVHNECEFIYGQDSGYVRPKKKKKKKNTCVSGYMEFQNRDGR